MTGTLRLQFMRNAEEIARPFVESFESQLYFNTIFKGNDIHSPNHIFKSYI